MKADNRNIFAIKAFLREYLDLRKDKDNELATVDSIRKGVEFKGANLWILIFAIFMASLGLNVNSTAVIIGAMLISPLMGPIMGVGLSVGMNDFELMKRSLKSFLITTAFSVTTATVFFLFIIRIRFDIFTIYYTRTGKRYSPIKFTEQLILIFTRLRSTLTLHASANID